MACLRQRFYSPRVACLRRKGNYNGTAHSKDQRHKQEVTSGLCGRDLRYQSRRHRGTRSMLSRKSLGYRMKTDYGRRRYQGKLDWIDHLILPCGIIVDLALSLIFCLPVPSHRYVSATRLSLTFSTQSGEPMQTVRGWHGTSPGSSRKPE